MSAVRYAAGSAVLIVVAALLANPLDRVWPLMIVSLGTATLAYARWVGALLGAALAVLSALIVTLLAAYVAPHTAWSFGTDFVIGAAAFGLIHAVVLGLPGAPERAGLRVGQLRDLAGAALLPSLVLLYFGSLVLKINYPWLGWTLAQDSANNLIVNRSFLAEGGLAQAGNAAPLTTIINSAWISTSLDGLSYGEQARAWLFSGRNSFLASWAMVSLLAGAMAMSRAKGTWGERAIWAALAAAQPWLWFAAGVASMYGYQNMFPALLVLLCGWICWLKRHDHTIAALSGLVLATWGAAVAWGPVAVIPASWLLAAAIATRRSWPRLRWRLATPFGLFCAAVLYAWKVTFADVAAQGGNLALDGAVPIVSYQWTFGLGAALVVAVLIGWRWIAPDIKWGVVSAAPLTALATYALIRQRAEMPTWWGYYPAKYSLLVLCLVAFLAASALQRPARALAARGWRGMGVGVALAALTVAMVKTVPPTPMAIDRMFTPMQWRADQTYDAPTSRMLAAIEENPKTLFAGFFPAFGGWLSGDYTLSFWTMEIASKDLSDQLRFAAYSYNPADGASVCAAVQAFGEGTVVYTRDSAMADYLNGKECNPGVDFTVKKRKPLPTP